MTKRRPHVSKLGVIERHLAMADQHRARAIELVQGIESLTGKLAELPVIPLDVLDRYERLIVAAHASNLLRLPTYGTLVYDESREGAA